MKRVLSLGLVLFLSLILFARGNINKPLDQKIKSGFLFYVPEEGIPEIRDGL